MPACHVDAGQPNGSFPTARSFRYLERVILRHLPRASLLAMLLCSALVVARPAWAAGEDASVSAAVGQIMTEEYPSNLGPAKKKLQDQLAICNRKGCSGPIKAQVLISIGMVTSQLGGADEAKASFAGALQADPSAKLPTSGVTPNIKSQWEDAKKTAPAAAPPPPAGGEEPPPPPPGGEEPAAGRAPPGWKSYDAFVLAIAALKADQEGRIDECVEKDKGSLKLEDQPRTRLHLASCEARIGKLVDALRDAQKALEAGLAKQDAGVMKVARVRVKELLDRIPHVTFIPPTGVTDLEVKFDDRPVPIESLTKKFSVDPGKHVVKAEGSVNGLASAFEQEVDVKERELATIRITLKPTSTPGGVVTEGQIKCMLAAKTQEEVQKCLPQSQKSLVIRVATDVSGYSDTNHVNVFSPGINGSLVSPTAGWNAGAHYILDVVSAASPDIVSTASPPFLEQRHAFGATGGYKPGLYGGQGSFNVSREPDYLSVNGGIAGTADLNDKLVTPRLAYSFSYDTIGRGPSNPLGDITPYKGTLRTHEFDMGVTFVMSPTSILLVGASLQFERGDQSKPYRYVPMFDAERVAPFVPVGATVDLVNRSRLPVRPLEQLPTSRDRYAVGARYNIRIGGNATLRLEERLYYDTWSTKATTTDARYMVDLSRHLRVWPHMRLHYQSAANFYQLAYSAVKDRDGTLILPTYRTGDRELAPLVTITAGGGGRIGLGAPEGETQYGITVVGDVMYSKFFNSLFVTTRTGIYGTVAFDVEF